MPLAPLFSPVYSTTRPYSQTKSNTQRDLMLPDEILRLDREKCIVLFQGHKPALLYKLVPENIPTYETLKARRIIDYTPAWKQSNDQIAKDIMQNDQQVVPSATCDSAVQPKQAGDQDLRERVITSESEYDYVFDALDLEGKAEQLSETSAAAVLGMEEDEDEG
jgi:type IV secretion system protein VirD4